MQIAEGPEPAVSFVVIAHNEQAAIEQTLSSILRQRLGSGELEVIVVDDGSTDSTGSIVESLSRIDRRVRVISLSPNRGRGFARATGVASARGQLVATVDADIRLPDGWLDRCSTALADADAVAGVAVPDGDVTYLHRRFGLTPKVVAQATDVTGSNALFRRELFDKVAYDPALRDGEDVALSHAMRAVGARTRVIEDLLVEHREHKSLRQSLAWMAQSGRGAARQLYRYREIRRPDVAFAGWLAVCILSLHGLRRDPRRAVFCPFGYLIVAASGHVAGAFVVDRRRAPGIAGAVVVDAGLLGAYFYGRVIGTFSSFIDLIRRRSRTAP